METFAGKVRYGNGASFDPMLEGKGGWISGEAPRHDIELADAVIEVIAEASQQAIAGEINPFKAREGEILPLNVERNKRISSEKGCHHI